MYYNLPSWLENIFSYFNEVNFIKVAKNVLQSSIMVGEKFEIHFFKVANNALQSSTVVGENFEIHFFKVAKMHYNHPPWLEKILKFTSLK